MPDETAITYTQHTVAFPQLHVSPGRPWELDQLSVELVDAAKPDDGSYGSLQFTFMSFDQPRTDPRAVQLAVFGEGLGFLFDERILVALTSWRAAFDAPDAITPAQLIELLETMAGAKPSSHHRRGLAMSADERTSLAARRR